MRHTATRRPWVLGGLVAAACAVAWLRMTETGAPSANAALQWLLTLLLLAASGVGAGAAWRGWREAASPGPRWPWLVPLALFALAFLPSAEPLLATPAASECTDIGFLPAALYRPLGHVTHGPLPLSLAGIGAAAGAAGLARRALRRAAAWTLAAGAWHFLLLPMHSIANGCWGA